MGWMQQKGKPSGPETKTPETFRTLLNDLQGCSAHLSLVMAGGCPGELWKGQGVPINSSRWS